MNVTYIGLPNECGTKVCNYLAETHSVTLITDKKPIYEIECNILVQKSLWISDYFENNPSDIVIYNDINNNYSLLNQWLEAAANNTKNFIVIKQGSFETNSQNTASIEELLCNEYSRDTSTIFTVLSIPALYGTQTVPNSIKIIIDEVNRKNLIEMPDGLMETCDALHIEDFCAFLSCFIESKIDDAGNMYFIQSGYTFSAEDLFKKINSLYPQAKNLYDKERLREGTVIDSLHLENWTPKHSFIDELDLVISTIENYSSQDNKRKIISGINAIGRILLFLLAFIIVELYVNFVSVASDLQFVDMRLIFIALSAVVLNQRYAVAGSLLCSAASIAHALSNGYRWHVLFFHVNNWIPIAIYILFAMIIGFYADRIKKQNK